MEIKLKKDAFIIIKKESLEGFIMEKLEVSDRIKIKIAAELVQWYYKSKYDKVKSDLYYRIGSFLDGLSGEDTHYKKAFEYMYINGWSVKKAARKAFSSQATMLRHRDKILLKLYNTLNIGVYMTPILFIIYSIKRRPPPKRWPLFAHKLEVL